MATLESLGGDNDFRVGMDTGWDNQPRYCVRLPHQCDEWEITWSQNKAESVAQMETFIAEAQTALAKLKELS